jgi:hypothetical protein
MKTIYFRFLTEDEKPTGWIGFASAKTTQELFDIIEEFGDPYLCEICETKTAGFCVHWKPFNDESGDAVMEKPPELIESMPWVFDDEHWVKPSWRIN